MRNSKGFLRIIIVEKVPKDERIKAEFVLTDDQPFIRKSIND